MTLQSLVVALAVLLSAGHFLRGLLRDLREVPAGGCDSCASGGCPAARKG